MTLLTVWFLLISFVLLVTPCYSYTSNGYSYDRRNPRDVMVEVINNLGLSLLEVHNQHNENNIALSPYGATSVLVALFEGLVGESAYEIMHVLRLPQDLSVTRVGLRDIHRHLKSYFIPKEGFLAGLTLNHENITLNREYETILRFYGYDIDSFNNPVYTDLESTTKTTTTTLGTTTEEIQTTTEITSTLKPPTTRKNDETTQQTKIPEPEEEITSTTTKKLPTRATTQIVQTTENIERSETNYPSTTTENGNTRTSVADTTVFHTTEAQTVTFSKTTVFTTTDGVTEKITLSPSINEVDYTTKNKFETTTDFITTESDQEGRESENLIASETDRSNILTTQSATTQPASSTIPSTTNKSSGTTTIPSDTTPPGTSSIPSTSIRTTTIPSESFATITEQSSKTTSYPTTDDSGKITTQSGTTFTTTTTKENKFTTNNIPEETTTSKFTTKTYSTTSKVDSNTILPAETTIMFWEDNITTQNLNTETTTILSTTVSTDLSDLLIESLETTDNPAFTTQSITSVNTETTDITTIKSDIATKINNISTTPKINEPKRNKRSVFDYLIARYYDNYYINSNRRYLPQPHYSNYKPDVPYTFLINGKYREPNISFMTYDTVLPFYYIPELDAMALSFPLDSNMYYLLLVLPVDEQGIDKLIHNFKKFTTLERIVQNLKYTHVKAVIPSFMLKGYVILTPSLQKLCIRKIFEPRHADFSLLTPEKDIYVTNIEQAVTVTIRNYVDPSSATARNLQAYRPVEFKANHPFLYFVMDSQIHVNLMAGKIINPLNSRIR